MSDVYEVQVTDLPTSSQSVSDDAGKESSMDAEAQKPDAKSVVRKESNRILVSIKMTNGISITQGNLDYLGLRCLVEKLEVLC